MLSNSATSAPAEEEDSMAVNPSTTQLHELTSCNASRVPGHETADDLESESDEQESVPLSQQFHPVLAIIAERSKEYLVEWDGVDDDGKPWLPTWEPRGNITADVIEEWDKTGRAEWKRAQKERKRASKIAAKAGVKGKGKVQEAVTAITRRSSSVTLAVKRSESAAPSQKPKLGSIRVLSDSEEEDVLLSPAPSTSTSLLRKRKSSSKLAEPAKQRIRKETPPPLPASPDGTPPRASGAANTALQQELGGPNVDFESFVPDSQGLSLGAQGPDDDDEMLSFEEVGDAPAIAPTAAARSAHLTLPPPPSSDVEVLPARALSQRPSTTSTSTAPPRAFGPVPVPRPQAFASAFASHNSAPDSSQADPIEDPDSSPPRRPLANRHANAAPAPAPSRAAAPALVPLVKPSRPQLELVASNRSAEAIPSSQEDNDEENQSSSADSLAYVSQPVTVGASKARALAVGVSGPFSARAVTSIRMGSVPVAPGAGRGSGGPGPPTPLVKVPFFRPPTPEGDDDDGGAGPAVAASASARIATLMASQVSSRPSTSDLYEQSLPVLDPIELDRVMARFDTPGACVGGAGVAGGAGVVAAPAAGPSDAGEGGDGGRGGGSTNGNAGGGGYQPSSNSSQQPRTQEQQQPSRSNSSNGRAGPSSGGSGAYYGSYSTFGAPSPYGGGGYNAYNSPNPSASGHSTPKRELEDSGEDAVKRARTSQRPTPEAEPEHRLPPPPLAPIYHPYAAPYPGYPPYPPPHGYPFPPPPPPHMPYGHHQPPPYMTGYPPPPIPPPPHQNMPASLARVLGPTTTGPNPVPLRSPQMQPQAPPAPPNVIAPSPVSGVAPSLPPAPSAGASALSPRRQRSQSPVGAVAPLKSPSLARAATFGASGAVSRNASPAPGISNPTEGLIKLVSESAFIVESDQTKAEIIKFIQDSHGYISRPDQPLCRAAHWAFELRRLEVDGVEKIDFIIIDLEKGVYQLKRVAQKQSQQFDFAQSLSHSPRAAGAARGSTPAVETGPPAPLAVSSMTLEQLQKEVESLRKTSKAQSEELIILRPASAEVLKLRTEVEKLTKTNKSLSNAKETAQADLGYIQTQYSVASSAAVERAREAEVAEAETAKLRGMLDVGLKQRDLVAKGEARRLREEVRRLKTEVGMCKAVERRVQKSGVLDKASKWDEWCAREKFEREMYDDREQAMLEEEEEEEREREREEKEERERERAEDEEKERTAEVLRVDSQAVGAATEEEVKVEQFACEWRVDKGSQVEPCNATLDSRDALLQHLSGHLPSQATALSDLP